MIMEQNTNKLVLLVLDKVKKIEKEQENHKQELSNLSIKIDERFRETREAIEENSRTIKYLGVKVFDGLEKRIEILEKITGSSHTQG